MITIYGIKNCDTCRKALKWLEAEGHVHKFHDFRIDGLGEKTVRDFIDGLGMEAVLNRRSTTWRELDEESRSILQGGDQGAGIKLLVQNPTLIKRPVFDTGKGLLNGFGPGQIKALSAD
jgi:arsenate reductase (glutaredoxin)